MTITPLDRPQRSQFKGARHTPAQAATGITGKFVCEARSANGKRALVTLNKHHTYKACNIHEGLTHSNSISMFMDQTLQCLKVVNSLIYTGTVWDRKVRLYEDDFATNYDKKAVLIQ